MSGAATERAQSEPGMPDILRELALFEAQIRMDLVVQAGILLRADGSGSLMLAEDDPRRDGFDFRDYAEFESIDELRKLLRRAL